jgi:ribosome-binding factor A
MKPPSNRSVQEMKSLCAELRPEDGLPPHILKRKQQHEHSGPNIGCSQQYSKAVHRALEAGLASTCGDERLKSLVIHAVEAMPGGSKLLVVVTSQETDPQALKTLEQALQKASGLLRSVVAMDIQRKRTPHLTFRVVPES